MRKSFLVLVAAAMILAACGANNDSTEEPDLQATIEAMQAQSTEEAVAAEKAAMQAEIDDLEAQLADQSADDEDQDMSKEDVSDQQATNDSPMEVNSPPPTMDSPNVSEVWGQANVQASGVTTKKAVSKDCNMPTVLCYLLSKEGVLGADDYDEAMANPSAIWTGSADHQTAQGPVVGSTVPEAGYWTAFAESFNVVVGDYHLILNRTDDVCGWGLLIRGLFSVDGKDRHMPITISDYGAVGAMKYTRYAVPVESGQYFSQDYWTDQFESALDFDNCGIGDKDAFAFYGGVLDLNDGSFTVDIYDENGWAEEVTWTNVVGHGNK